jgi:putative endonuclease
MTSYQTGLRAENLAAWFLRLKGYRILARRYKTPVGEIDLVARQGKAIVFVEVKARGAMDAALESIHQRQAGRIMRAAEYYLSAQRQTGSEMRFDVIAIRPPFHLSHLRGAFHA